MLVPLAILHLLTFADRQAGKSSKPQVAPRDRRITTFSEEREVDARLYVALSKGDVARVRDLLAKGADPNANEANGWRPLLRIDGTPAQRLEITKLLVAKGANVKYRQPDQGWTALTSVLNGSADLPTVRYLILKGAPVNVGMTNGFTALHFAARSRDVAIVRELLKAGANVKARAHEEKRLSSPDESITGSPLERRSRERSQRMVDEENAAMAARYFEPGVRGTGRTPIFSLVGAWNEAILDELLKAGASLDETDDDGWTLLHWAISQGDLQTAGTLLKRGLDPNLATKGGFRPLHNSMRVGFGFPSEDGVKLLLAAGADPKATNAVGQTPLDLLRADTERNLGEWQRDLWDDPQTREMVPGYLDVVNKIARRLDPNAAPIVLPPPAPPVEKPFEPIEFHTLAAERTFLVEDGRTFLEFAVEAPTKGATLVIENLLLDDYEPVTPLPLSIKVAARSTKTVRIEFPNGVRRDQSFSMKWKEGDAGGELGQGRPFEPKFVIHAGSNGLGVYLKNEHADRTLEVTLDRVKITGRASPALAGRRLQVAPKSEIQIEGLFVPRSTKSKVGAVRIGFRQRLLPNAHWIEGDAMISSEGR